MAKARLTVEWDTPVGGTFSFDIDYDDVVIAHQVAAVLRRKPPRVTVDRRKSAERDTLAAKIEAAVAIPDDDGRRSPHWRAGHQYAVAAVRRALSVVPGEREDKT